MQWVESFHGTSDDAPLFNDDAQAQLTVDVRDALEKTVNYVLRSADYARKDRLWPADGQVFTTNPLSVTYGACGPALLLHTANLPLGVPDRVINWIVSRPLSVDSYPPGLYMGLAGIAYTLQEIGLQHRAEEAMEMLYQSPLLFEEPAMFLGAAGWGLASLYQFKRTGRKLYLDWAVRAGEHLIQTAQHEDDTYFWPVRGEGRIHYGFGYGASGIALFLLYLHSATRESEFRDVAVQALEFDLAHRIEGELGWNWQRFDGDSLIRPYWIHGGAGVGSVVIRFSHLLDRQRYEPIARRIAHDLFIKFTVTPGLYAGLAGIGEFMLDMYCLTGEEVYRRHAFDMAETILWFKIDKPKGVAWPGRWLDRISNDYSSGGAGIGLFLARLLRPERRLFVDL